MGHKRHTVALAGLGNRGKLHLRGILRNADRFELKGICDINGRKLEEASRENGIKETFADAGEMLASTKPDVFVFVTQPDVRLPMVELAVRHKVRGLAFEKPMATSLAEAHAITRLCEESGIKAVVSHQQKYLTSMQAMKRVVDSGDIGKITQINVSTKGWMSPIGTHYMDYAIWANGGRKAKWVVGHVNGKGKLSDISPSPDYAMGQVEFENGVRLFTENGYLSKARFPADEKYWLDNRITVYGTTGYVWAETDGIWGGCVRGELQGGQGGTWGEQEPDLQVAYLSDFADWLDDDAKVHPCNIGVSYHGYEILEALCASAIGNKVVRFPVDVGSMPDMISVMRETLT
ncbi:MAG: Gfo/Idh/MocA family oxidoreductase [Oscillospiraceae bacterium]|nr:Gfo/Idh/MocA family oxidoreductase [Oscillospiraceae bacterium]